MIGRRFSMLLMFVAPLAIGGGTGVAACGFADQGEGRVSGAVDARTLRLDDGREVRLAGIEIPAGNAARAHAALAALTAGRDVILRHEDDRPDRYGRQPAFVFAKGAATSLQAELLARGEALIAVPVTDKACLAAMQAAEATARTARRGIWAGSNALKNAERADDILAGVGQFTLVEGTVSSARLAGGTFYVNFGRRWTEGLTLTISRRLIPSFEATGLDLKSLKNKRIQARGWIERRGGPRIEVIHPGQIELVAAADATAGIFGLKDEGR